jgi:uncharacterized integral membrane protein
MRNEEEKIVFYNLSMPLKVAIILSYITGVLSAIAFFVGFISELLD